MMALLDTTEVCYVVIKTHGTKMEAESEDGDMKKSSSTFVETIAGQMV